MRNRFASLFKIGRQAAPIAILISIQIPVAAGILGSAQDFAVIGTSMISNTGSTTLFGNLGLYPGTSITGLGSISITGTVHQTDAAGQLAVADALVAFNALAPLAVTGDLTGQDLGTVGLLTAGVYSYTSSAQLTGTLTLDALGDPNAQFVFVIGSTLTTASSSAVNVVNGGAGTGVFWVVGSSATLGTGTSFAGNLLSAFDITLNTSATILCGRALALNGAVTMDTNSVSNSCEEGSRGDFGSLGFAGESTGVPEPASAGTVGLGILGLAGWHWRNRRRNKQG